MALPRCSECGMLHPPTAPGQCPMAKDQKIEEDLKANKQNYLSECIITIKEEMFKNLKNKDDNIIKVVVAKVRNIINNV